MKSVCVYCGSSPGRRTEYLAAARDLGRAMARRSIRLVYGGGSVGLMGAVADAVMAAGGEVVGFIPRTLMGKEVDHQGITELIVTDTMHERKQGMADRSDAFVALPGGFGTMEELCEVLAWTQLSIHAKPVAVLNVENFFDPLLALFDHAVKERFLRDEHRRFLLSGNTPDEVLDLLAANPPVLMDKWLDSEVG